MKRFSTAFLLLSIWLFAGLSPASVSARDGSVTAERFFSLTAGPNFAGTGADDSSIGTPSWFNPGRIVASDNSRSTNSPIADNTITHYLKATNFSFSIPTGATINGIQVDVEANSSYSSGGTSGMVDWSAKIVKGGTISGTDQAVNASLTTSDAIQTFGGSSSLWGLSWTDTDINASTFGFVIAYKNTTGINNQDISVDAIKITVTYTPSGSGGFFRLFNSQNINPYDRPRSLKG